MASSGRSTPLAREKVAQMHAERDSAAVAATYLAGASPQQSSTSHMVESSTKDTPHKEPEPAATDLIDTIPEDDDAAAQRPHINATNNADTTTAILENKVPHASSGGKNRPPRRSWRSLPVIQRLRQWLSEEQAIANFEAVISNVETDQEDFRRWIRIINRAGNNDDPEEALAMFDTQCPEDWISVAFLKETWDVDFSSRPKTIIAGTLNNAAVYSFGRINLAWSSRDNRCDWLHGKLFFKPKTYRSTFEVIDTDEFDVIIGQKTIVQQQLLVFNRFFGLFKAHRHAARKVTQTQIADSQARADVRRDEAQRLRSQVGAQSTQAGTGANTEANNGP